VTESVTKSEQHLTLLSPSSLMTQPDRTRGAAPRNIGGGFHYPGGRHRVSDWRNAPQYATRWAFDGWGSVRIEVPQLPLPSPVSLFAFSSSALPRGRKVDDDRPRARDAFGGANQTADRVRRLR
jgi:hypothetical protein